MKALTMIVAAVVLGAMVQSCGLYKKYDSKLADSAVDEIFATATTDGDTVLGPLAAMPWRELFIDPTLRIWIDSALTRNTDLRAAALRVEEAAARVEASRLSFFPSLGIEAQGSVSDSRRSFSIGPSASWELDIFGRQRNGLRVAEATAQGAEAYRQAVQTSLVAALARSYYNLLTLDRQLAISERTLTTWDENIRVMQALKRAGRANEAGVLQARANRLKVENSAHALRQQIREQENAVRSLLLAPDMDLTRGTLEEQHFPDLPVAGVPLVLLSNRPDVREAERALASTFYSVNVARAAFYPSLVLSGNVAWQTAGGTSVSNPAGWIANVLGNLVAPLFSRGTNRANLRVAQAEHEAALLAYEQRLVDAAMEVNNALGAWRTARERLDVDKKQIVALKGAVHNTRLLMRNSTTNYLEVLTAQQRLLEAELAEVDDRYSLIRSVVDAYTALGGASR